MLLALAAGSAPALATVTVVLSDKAKSTFKKNGRDWTKIQKRLNGEFNKGLEELGKKHAGAKALFDSGQTIRIVCKKDAEAKRLKIKLGFAPAATHGDFDKKGKPKKGGTTVIVIRCKKLGRFGLDKPFFDIDPRSTGFKILVHELLHASDKARRHPPDSLEIYKKFVDDFMEALRIAKKKKKSEKTASSGTSPITDQQYAFASLVRVALDLNLSLIHATGQVYPTFGNSLSGSNNTSEVSLGADIRAPIAQLAEGLSLVGGGWAKVFPEGGKTVAVLERHAPTPGKDTRMLQDQLAFLFAYTGIQISNLGLMLGDPMLCATGAMFCNAAWTLFFGPWLQINKVTLETDESGGGGTLERFSKTEAKLGFTIGTDLDIPFETGSGFRFFTRLGGAVDYTPATKVSGTSGLSFDYSRKVRSHVDWRVFIGIGVELPPGIFASDRRLKRDISWVGRTADGLDLYRYRYIFGGPEWIGVMAQDVA